MVLNGIIDQLIFVLLLAVALVMYAQPLKKRENGTWLFLLCLLGLIGLVLLFAFYGDVGPLQQLDHSLRKNLQELVLMVLLILSLKALKKAETRNLVFIGCISIATANCIVHLYSFAATFIFGPNGLIQGGSETVFKLIRLAMLAGTAITFFLLFWFQSVRHFFKNGYRTFQYSIDKSILIFYCGVILINMFIGTDFDQLDTMTYRYILISRISFNLLVLFFVFQQANYIAAKAENTQMAYIMETQQKQFETARENVDAINIKAHDLKHFVEVFQSGCRMSQAQREELTQLSRSYDATFQTGRQALDITLNEKCKNFDELGIEYSIMADGSALEFMGDVDIYALFGNMLDNGKEALQLCRREERILTLNLRQNENFVILHMENTCARAPRFQDGTPVTSKEDPVGHGYGVRSIRQIVDKYNGNLKMEYTDHLFIADILFQKTEPTV